jgi:thioredoxin reductase
MTSIAAPTNIAERRRRRPASAEVDVLIVGGGPAGLSAALVLGRARKRVLVLDSGRPANAVSNHIGGLLAQTGVAPTDLRRSGREQLRAYRGVELREAEAVDVERRNTGFLLALDDGATVSAPALVLAHGLRYEPPQLPGIEGLWGRSVFHCPFCDGWEVRDRRLALRANGPDAVESALLIATWSDEVVLLTDGPAKLGPGRATLERAGVRVREEAITRLAGRGGELEQIEFSSGRSERCDALFVRTRRDQPNGLASALGCALSPADTIVTDADGRTDIAGLYAAGDAATEHSRSVANAMGAGSRVAYAAALDARVAMQPGLVAA